MPIEHIELTLENKENSNPQMKIFFDSLKSLMMYPFGLFLGCNAILLNCVQHVSSISPRSRTSIFALSTDDIDNNCSLKHKKLISPGPDDGFLFSLIISQDFIFDFYNSMKKPLNNSILKVLAELKNIHYLELKLLCSNCNYLYNHCSCPNKDKTNKCQIDFLALIDDNTSVLKVTYENDHYIYIANNLFFAIFQVQYISS